MSAKEKRGSRMLKPRRLRLRRGVRSVWRQPESRERRKMRLKPGDTNAKPRLRPRRGERSVPPSFRSIVATLGRQVC